MEEAVARVKELLGVPSDRYPIDVLGIASALGVRVYEAEFGDPNVFLLVVADRRRAPDWVTPGERATLLVSKKKPPLQKAFAIAHGLGHVVLGHVGEGGFRVDAVGEGSVGEGFENSKAEREANRFAAALLMPEGPFRRVWEALAGRGVHYVGALFGVSANVAAVRAEELGLEVPLP
jgi:Zn-dependent peptidase ImmA (M78 family)